MLTCTDIHMYTPLQKCYTLSLCSSQNVRTTSSPHLTFSPTPYLLPHTLPPPPHLTSSPHLTSFQYPSLFTTSPHTLSSYTHTHTHTLTSILNTFAIHSLPAEGGCHNNTLINTTHQSKAITSSPSWRAQTHRSLAPTPPGQ